MKLHFTETNRDFRLHYTVDDSPLEVMRCYLNNRLRRVLKHYFGSAHVIGLDWCHNMVLMLPPSLYEAVISPVITEFLLDYVPFNFDLEIDLRGINFIVFEFVPYEE